MDRKKSVLAGEFSPGSLPSLCSITQAKQSMSVSRETVRRMLKKGILRHVVLNGKTIRIPIADIEKLAGGL